jgi:hypothetical protein
MHAAVAALDAWDDSKEPEPTGWVRAIGRNSPPFRRRPDGDPSREYVSE